MRAGTNYALLTVALLVSTLVTGSGQPAPAKPGEWAPAGQSRVVTWQVKRLPPPSPLYVTVDDVLRVKAASAQVGEVVTVSYRLLRAADGAIIYGQFVTPAMPNTTPVTFDQPLTEGFLLSVSCRASIAITRGDTFVRLFLNPKALGAGQPGYMMMADYVTTGMAPGFPNGRVLAPTEGPGVIYVAPVTTPPAGFDWSFQTKTNTRVRLVAVRATLATSAAAGTRTADLAVNQAGGGTEWATQPFLTQGPSSTVQYTAANGLVAPASIAQGNNWPLPADARFTPACQILTGTGALDAADQWSSIFLTLEQWLDNV